MSQIKIKQIDDDNLIVEVGPDTPVDTINRLCKGFSDRGLTEDLTKSTVSERHFYRPQDRVNDLADELIKSLYEISGLAKVKSPHTQMFYEQRAQSKLVDRNASRARSGLAPINMDQMRNPAGQKPPGALAPRASSPNTPGAATLPGVPNKLVGEVGVNTKKSDYGPKGGGQYSVTDNIRRKLKNVGEQSGVGPNVNTKRYNTRTQAGQQTDPSIKRKQPAKVWSPEMVAAENARRGLKKAWGQHLEFPNGDEMVEQYEEEFLSGDEASAQQLANMMNSKAMLRPNHRIPTTEDMIMAGQQMGFGETKEIMKAQDENWGNSINNWLNEAVKPISARFASEEEEMAYWNSIRVSDAPDGNSGY